MKAVIKISLSLLLIMLLFVSALIALLTTSYSPWITQKLVAQFAPAELYIQDIHYQFPDSIELKQLVVSKPSNPSMTLDKAVLVFDLDWNNPLQPLFVKRAFLDGMNVPTGFDKPRQLAHWLQKWQPESIHVKHLDFANKDFVARDFEFVFAPEGKPQFDSLKNFFSQGYLSAAGDQIYWKGEAFNEFKLRAKLAPKLTQVDQLDFIWRGGDVQLIAEKKDQSWTINDILINHLRLSRSEILPTIEKASQPLLSHIHKIEHAKSYQSSWHNGDWQLNQANIELSNWDLRKSFWQQDAEVSLSAESFIKQEAQILEPDLSMTLRPENLQMNQLEFLFEQGKVELSGEIYPDQLHLSKLSIANLEWVQEDNLQQKVLEQLAMYTDISIDQLAITRSQIISRGPHSWQVSNLNAQGTELSIRDDSQWALWQGNLSASANSLSLFGKNSLRPYIEMQSEQGHWKVNELFVPIQEGLIEAKGNIDLSRTSKPWTLDVKAYGLSLDTLTPSLHLALGWYGLADLNLELQGLAGDELMLKRSLDGKARISAHDVRVQLPFDTTKLYPIIIPEIQLSARRGHIEVPDISIVSEALKGKVTGSIDLADPTQNQLAISLSNDCMELKKALPEGRSQLSYQCD